MRCGSCGGNVVYRYGTYVCESCGAAQTGAAEVYLCYREESEQGGRTRESAIAQDIYSRLMSNGVSVFYQRVSAAGLKGRDLALTCTEAISRSAIIVIIGTNPMNFRFVMGNNLQFFRDKTVIPVYASMRARDIPEELRHLRSVEYNNNASADMLTGIILNELGRGGASTPKKKGSWKIIAIVTAVCLLIAAGSFIGISKAVEILRESRTEEQAENESDTTQNTSGDKDDKKESEGKNGNQKVNRVVSGGGSAAEETYQYNSSYDYARMNDIHNSEQTDSSVKKDMDDLLYNYNLAYVKYVNTQNKNTEVFNYLRAGTNAYKLQMGDRNTNPNLSTSMNYVTVKNVREYNGDYYVWADESFTTRDGGNTINDMNHWIYRVKEDNGGYYIDDFMADPAAKK